jgi:integrase
LPISELTPGILEQYKSSNAHTPGATNNSLHVLHTLFEKAVLWGHVRENPMRRVTFLKARPSRARMLLDEERGKLVKSAKADLSPYIYRFILWQLNTGMRPKETVSIREGDVDLKYARVRLGVTKSNRPRYVPLNKTTLDIVWALWHGDGGCLFRGANGQSLTVHAAQRIFRRVATNASVNVRLYDCRHDALSRMAAGGASLPTLQSVSGHRTLSMVSLYLHLSPDHYEQTKQAIERAEVQGVRDDQVTTSPADEDRLASESSENESDFVRAVAGSGYYGKSGRGSQAEYA